MASVYRNSYTVLDKATGKRIKKLAKKWYIEYIDHTGKPQKVAGFKDKRATEVEAIRLETQAERIRCGLLPVEVLNPERPLTEHLADFIADLAASKPCPEHLACRKRQVERIVSGCSFTQLGQIEPLAVRRLLSSWMDGEDDMSAQTANHYLTSIKHFCRWLVDNKRLPSHPLSGCESWDVETDRRIERRVLTDDEFERLIQATEARGQAFGMTGRQRALLYLVAAYSGFRASELCSFRACDLISDGGRYSLRIAAEDAKDGTDDAIPLPLHVGRQLADFTRGLKPEDPIWPSWWADMCHGARMLAKDLKAAGIEKFVGGLSFDFHALRCQYATNLLNAEIPLAHAQRLMRHSTPELTMRVYAKLGLSDLAKQVGKMDRDAG